MKYALLVLIAGTVVPQPGLGQEPQRTPSRITGYREFNYGQIEQGVEQWVQAIRVTEPELRSDVQGDVTVKFAARGMTQATAMCWQQPFDTSQPWGQDASLTPDGITLDAQGRGEFVFFADRFPHGPVNVRIYAHNGQDRKDIFELQLFNTGGTTWQGGIPQHDPPAAKGLKLILADDFTAPLSDLQ